MAQAVYVARDLADDKPGDDETGTTIELRKSPDREYHELDFRHMAPSARLLEILLDRLTWTCQVSSNVRGAYRLGPDHEQGAKTTTKPRGTRS